MLIFKPKYVKKGGSIKALINNPRVQRLAIEVATGAAKKLFGKRKYNDIINTTNKFVKVLGKGIVYE